jgi:hypothetical protein
MIAARTFIACGRGAPRGQGSGRTCPGRAIGPGDPLRPADQLLLGYLLDAAVTIAGGLVAWFLAIDAEGR